MGDWKFQVSVHCIWDSLKHKILNSFINWLPCVMTKNLLCIYTPRKLCLWWGILFSRCPSVRPCVRPSVTFCFLNNLKSNYWIFIKLFKNIHICKTVRPSVTFCFLNNLKSNYWIFIKLFKNIHICKTLLFWACLSVCPSVVTLTQSLYPPQTLFVVGILFSRCPCVSVLASVCASVRNVVFF